MTIPAMCLLATLGGWSWSKLAESKWGKQIEASQQRVDTADELVNTMLNAETGMQRYLLSGAPMFLETYRSYQRHLRATVDRLGQSSALDRSKLTKIAVIRSHLQSLEKLTLQLQTAVSAAENLALLKQGKQATDTVRREITDFQRVERAALARQYTELANFQSLARSLQQLFTFAGVMSTIAGIYLFWLLDRELSNREERIQTSKMTIETLNNDIIDAIALVDSRGRINKVNPASVEMFGYEAEDLLGSYFMRLLVPPTPEDSQPLPELTTWLERKPKLGRVWQTEAYRQDGKKMPIELSLSKIPHKQQSIVIVRDVSEQVNLMQQLHLHLNTLKQLNLTLVNVNSSLERRNQELAEFAHVTAHDLKTPVRGIATLSEWIEEEVKTHPSQQLQHYIQLMRHRIYRLDGLIDGLCEYTSLGQTPTLLEPIKLPELLHQLQSTLALPSQFKIELHLQDLSMTTCKSHLCKVIKELLKNAVKHHDRDRGQIDIWVELSGEKVLFTIKDDGPGIAPEYHQRVFRLFETVEPRDAHKNMGIGLTMAKKLVERVSGKIWLETPPSGRGLSVRFTWPQHGGAGERG